MKTSHAILMSAWISAAILASTAHDPDMRGKFFLFCVLVALGVLINEAVRWIFKP